MKQEKSWVLYLTLREMLRKLERRAKIIFFKFTLYLSVKDERWNKFSRKDIKAIYIKPLEIK